MHKEEGYGEIASSERDVLCFILLSHGKRISILLVGQRCVVLLKLQAWIVIQ